MNGDDRSIVMRDGSLVADSRLGRLVHFDERSRGYSVARLREQRPRRSRGHRPGPVLDQGEEGQCVSEMCHARRNGSPHRRIPPVTEFSARQAMYWEIQRRDPFPGGSYPGASPVYGGTSEVTGLEMGRELGWWDSYWWCGAGSGDVIGDLVYALGHVGGVCLAIPWFNSMYRTRPSGLVEIDVSSGLAGYHAIYTPSILLKLRLPGEWTGTKEAICWQNSWGLVYGVGRYQQAGGFGYVLLDDVGQLLERDGSAAVPVTTA